MSDIKILQKAVIDFRQKRDWEQFHNPKDVSISLVLEATELLEHFQWKNEEEVLRHVELHKEEVADEVADIFYWILLLSHDLKINLQDALSKKMAKNAQKYPAETAKGNHKKYTELAQ